MFESTEEAITAARLVIQGNVDHVYMILEHGCCHYQILMDLLLALVGWDRGDLAFAMALADLLGPDHE